VWCHSKHWYSMLQLNHAGSKVCKAPAVAWRHVWSTLTQTLTGTWLSVGAGQLFVTVSKTQLRNNDCNGTCS